MAKSKILVVDDSATDTMLISTPLRAEGYEVITARDGEEALRRLDSDSPDLVLLDVVMPGKNGFQLCRQIRNDARYGKSARHSGDVEGSGSRQVLGHEAGRDGVSHQAVRVSGAARRCPAACLRSSE